MRRLGVLLFPGFELLDVFGPVEVFANRNLTPPLFDTVTVAPAKGLVESAQGPKAPAEFGLDDCPPLQAILVPGGMGTRQQVENAELLAWLRARCADAELVLTVCTGTSLLARAGILDGRRATTNKRSFDWVVGQGPGVQWVRRARWVEDGKFTTSSGVTAGIDMALAVVARLSGIAEAERIAAIIEHVWNRDPDVDPFA